MMEKMAVELREEAANMLKIDENVARVAEIVDNNSATSEECAAASVELSDQASRMRDLISVYKLGDDNDTYASEVPSKSRRYVATDNEQIISLGDGFGKY